MTHASETTSRQTREHPLVSVLVTNHNYAPYLREALDSVLAQTYQPIQLVVIDDGSTDGSRAVIGSYGSQVEAILQVHGGHASACNSGLRACRGELVCFLDADDLFLPGKVERVMAAWMELPSAALVYHRLETVDADGAVVGSPWPRQLWRGWIRERIETTGGWYPRPPASGLALTRPYLERLLPIPTEPQGSRLRPGDELMIELKPDSYLSEPAAFVAPVIGLPETLGRYRIHGRNKSQADLTTGSATADKRRRRLHQTAFEFHTTQSVLHDRFGAGSTASLGDRPDVLWLQRALREVSLPRALRVIAGCATLRGRERARELVRAALGRGLSRRVVGGGVVSGAVRVARATGAAARHGTRR